MKRMIEIDDTLEEIVNDSKEELKDDFDEYLKKHPEMKDFDEYYQEQGADRMSEITDSNTPIYYSEIDGLYYLYGDILEEAYQNAGIGFDGKENNYRQVAIYCYIQQELNEYLQELQEEFEEGINENN